MNFKISLSYLKKHRFRTFFLILGIALSVMLIFGFNTINETQNKNQFDMVSKLYGGYNVEFKGIDKNTSEKLKNDQNIKYFSSVFNFGDIVSNSGISIDLESYNKKYVDMRGYTLVKGRAPTSKNEIILEKEALKKLNLKVDTNQYIDFKVKKEYEDKNGQKQIFNKDEKFKVVGLMEKPSIYYGDTYLLKAFTSDNTSLLPTSNIDYDSVASLKTDINNLDTNVMSLLRRNSIGRLNYETNSKVVQAKEQLVDAQNGKVENNIKIMIFIAAIFFIYNLFNISLNEIINEIGLLRVVGASKLKVRSILIIQSLIVMILGIILGLILGYVFSLIGVKTFNFTLNDSYMMIQRLVINSKSILYAIGVGVLAVVVSSVIPIFTVGRISPIDAVFKTDKIKIKSRDSIISKMMFKFFGITGEMAYKNIMRNKVRAIISIVSISLGGILFIYTIGTVHSDFLQNSNMDVVKMQDTDFSLSYGANRDTNMSFFNDKDVKNIKKIKNVINISTKKNQTGLLENKYSSLSSDFITYNGVKKSNKIIENGVNLNIYDNLKNMEKYKKFIINGNLDNIQNRTGGYTNVLVFDYYYDVLNSSGLKKIHKDLKVGDVVKVRIPVIKDGNTMYEEKSVRVAGILSPEWLMKGDSSNGRYLDMVTVKQYANDFENTNLYSNISISCKSGTDEYVNSKLERFIKNKPYVNLESKVSYEDKDRKDSSEFNKFQYTIVVFILIVAAINIYFSIRFNLMIRIKEFSSLRAIGMSMKNMNLMLIIESLIYGILSVVIAAIISVYKLYKFAIQADEEYKAIGVKQITNFHVPTLYIIIFLVVSIVICLLSVYFSKKSINKISIVDGIKNVSD